MLHPASYRDPQSGVFVGDSSVTRFFKGEAIADLEHVVASGLLARLAGRELVLPFGRLAPDDADAAPLPAGSVGVRQPLLPFVSYPYEWSFSMLRDAALLHLQILVEALETDASLKDGSSFNVQFVGTRPVFIDLGSFMRYREGRPWSGFSQFCRMFLNPLLFASLTGVSFSAWLRGSGEGIPTADLARVLSLRQKLRPAVFVNVWLQSFLQSRLGSLAPDDRQRPPSLDRRALLRQVNGLTRTVRDLRAPTRSSGWLDYRSHETYSAAARADKLAYVERVLAAAHPRRVHDLGSNTGEFAAIAERSGADVVATDTAPDVIDAMYLRLRGGGSRILPLVHDAADPSPAQGWAGVEREPFASRARVDFVLALAVVHHLRFGANVPLARIVPWLVASAPGGIVEFVPRTDPAVGRLLRWRDDVFDDYERASFERELERVARIVDVHEVPDSVRVLYRFGPR